MNQNTIKKIFSILFNAALLVVSGSFLLKIIMGYIPFPIREWLAKYANELTQLWVLGFILTCFSGAIYLVMEIRSRGKTKYFWNVLVGVAFCLIYTVLATYMATDTLKGARFVNNLPFIFPNGFESMEEIVRSDEVPQEIKAKISEIYAQQLYRKEGILSDIYDENGSKFKFKPSIEVIQEREQWLATLAQGERLSSTLINRTIYYFSAFFIGLFVGYYLTKNRITSG